MVIFVALVILVFASIATTYADEGAESTTIATAVGTYTETDVGAKNGESLDIENPGNLKDEMELDTIEVELGIRGAGN